MKEIDKKRKIVYLAIIFSLLVHAIVLAVLYFVPLQQEEGEEYEPVDVETVEREEIPDLERLLDLHQEESQETRNVIASAESERSDEVRSYNPRSEEEVQEEIDQRLKNLEQEVIDDLREQGKGFDEERFEKKDQQERDELDQYDYLEENKKSYSDASVEYDLPGRDHLRLDIPSYKCMGRGTVVVKIEVDREGNVTSTSIIEEESTGSDCHREQALSYSAERSLFFNDSSAPRRQVGTITYKFFSQ